MKTTTTTRPSGHRAPGSLTAGLLAASLCLFATAAPSARAAASFTAAKETVRDRTTTTTTNTAPAITQQPASATITAGQAATFTIAANGAAPLSYQWHSSPNGATWSNVANNTTCSGATTATLKITNAPVALNNYKYRCLVANALGSITSATVTLAVNPPPPPPTITQQPANATINASDNVSITLAATSNTALSYQWQYSTNNGSTWSNAPDADPFCNVTSNRLVLIGVDASRNGMKLRCLVSNAAGGQVTSNTVTLTVKPVATPPEITAHPANATIGGLFPMNKGTASFSVTATGNPAPASYQWERSTNDGATWIKITDDTYHAGATKPGLALTNLGISATNKVGNLYRCVVTSPGGTITSGAALLLLPGMTGAKVTAVKARYDGKHRDMVWPVIYHEYSCAITVDKAGPVTYYWLEEHGMKKMDSKTIHFNQAGTQTVKHQRSMPEQAEITGILRPKTGAQLFVVLPNAISSAMVGSDAPKGPAAPKP